jgi:hypothetical protein
MKTKDLISELENRGYSVQQECIQTCECGHPSREICDDHTIKTCTFKQIRKIRSMANRLASAKKSTSEYRQFLVSKQDYFSPEFHFLCGVESLQYLLEDMLNYECTMNDLPKVNIKKL